MLSSNAKLSKMTGIQLLILLHLLKRKEDGLTPTVKKMMLEKYVQWKDRLLLIFEDVSNGEVVEEEGGGVVETDEIPEDEEGISAATMTLGMIGTETDFI